LRGSEHAENGLEGGRERDAKEGRERLGVGKGLS